jgi:hypothetical protein
MDHKTWLKTLIVDASKHNDSATRQSAVRTLLAEHPDLAPDALAAIEAEAISEFDKLHGDDATQLDALRTHADLIKALRAEKQARNAAPATAQTDAPVAPSTPAPATDAGQEPPAAPASTTDITPPAPQEAPQMDTTTAPAGGELVAASATKTVIRPADVPMPWEAMPFDAKSTGSSYVITAAAGAPGVEAGEQFDDFGRLAKLLSAKFESLGRGMSEPSQMMLASARPEDWSNAYANIARSGIAALGFEREHDFVMQHQHDWQVIERACNESRLPGGSLTPAPQSLTAAPGTPGWCAPCEVRYDFCPPAVLDGIVDLPTVIATRGCLTFPSMPDFGLLYQGTGFCYPAADYDLTTNPNADPVANPYWAKNKPCSLVPCPETQTCTLDPCGVCLQSSILVERAYPELIQYFIANALVAWGHRMNCRDLAQMITASTAVTVPRNQVGPGAMASVLEVLEFYATWLRYKYRLGRNASIEAVLPEWLHGVLRSDLSKRMGIDLLAVTDQMIDNWLAIRKVRVQWVLGLDESFCDTTGSTTVPPSQIDPSTSAKFGGDAAALGTTGPTVPPTLWPKNVSFLIYPAGTFFRARMNLVNIEGGLVDSALLKRNERLLLFVEEASTVCKRCYESLYITMPICPSGQAGAGSISQPVCETFPTP